MKTVIRNSYTPQLGDYCETIVVDKETENAYIFDCDGVFTQMPQPVDVEEILRKAAEYTDETVAPLAEKLDTIEEGAQVNVIEHVLKNGTELTITNKTVNVTVPTKTSELTNDGSDGTDTYVETAALSDYYTKSETDTQIGYETTAREIADQGLQTQIDAIVASSDVVDIVGTYAALQAYDTSKLHDNDIIKVLTDETRDDATTYYRWDSDTSTWSYIGSEGPYYTKTESDATFVPQTRKVNNKALSSDITLTASDVGALPDSTVIPTVNDATLTIQQNGVDVTTFTANSATNETANITVPTKTSDITNDSGFITEEDVYEEACETGKTITFQDAAPSQLSSFRLDGETSQNGTPTPSAPVPVQTVTGENVVQICGKNLLSYAIDTTTTNTGTTSTIQGTTWTIIKSGTGGISAAARTDYFPINLASGDSITFSSTPVSGSFSSGTTFPQIIVYWYDANKTQLGYTTTASTSQDITAQAYSKTYTASSNVAYFRVGEYIPGSTTGTTEEVVLHLQLELGSTATAYEPYQGQSYEVNLGKNLLNPTEISSTPVSHAGVDVSLQSDGTILLNGTATGDEWVNIMSGDFTTSAYNIINIGQTTVSSTNTDGTLSASVSNGTVARVIHDISNGYWAFFMQSGASYNNAVLKIQFEKGSTATDFAAYFAPIELCKIGDYQDYIYKSDGKWYKHQAIGKVIADGDTVWTKSQFGTNNYGFAKSGVRNVEDEVMVISDQTTGVSYLDRLSAGMICYYTANRIFIRNIDIDTVADLTTHCASNPMTFYYVLAAPTDTEITNATLIAQLEAVLAARTYAGTNNIFTITPNEQGTLEICYVNTILPYATKDKPGIVQIGDGLSVDSNGVISSDGLTSVDWDDIDNKPTNVSYWANDAGYITAASLPTVNDATLTIQKNGTNVATFSANSATASTANITVPTDTGDLTNGAGFITTAALSNYYTKSETYSQQEVNSLFNTLSIPTKTSDLTNDGSDGTSTYVEADDLAAVATTGDYDDLSNKPVIPTYSDFTGATSSTGGAHGLVPAPAAGDQEKYLKGDGTWATVQGGSSYTAGNGINITNDVISADTSVVATQTDLAGKQDTLTAGTNISISNNTISASIPIDSALNVSSTNPVENSVVTAALNGKSDEFVIMKYGESNAWAKFIDAYNKNKIVYCRASSNANPATGAQTRLAFMAYVNAETNPTNVEFQYVRSVSSKTDSQQCDQVFVYTLTNTSGGTWSVASRNMAPKINVSGPITKTFSNGANATVTIGADAMTGATASTAGAAGVVPAPAAGDDGKYLKGDGTWGTITIPTVPTKTSDLTNDGSDGTSTYVEADDLATVATSGDYNDLSNLPGIPNYTAGDHIDITAGVISATDYVHSENPVSITTPGTTVSGSEITDGSITFNKTAAGEFLKLQLTTTDPGEGAALAANTLLGVYQ